MYLTGAMPRSWPSSNLPRPVQDEGMSTKGKEVSLVYIRLCSASCDCYDAQRGCITVCASKVESLLLHKRTGHSGWREVTSGATMIGVTRMFLGLRRTPSWISSFGGTCASLISSFELRFGHHTVTVTFSFIDVVQLGSNISRGYFMRIFIFYNISSTEDLLALSSGRAPLPAPSSLLGANEVLPELRFLLSIAPYACFVSPLHDMV
jgi:hypothetical protein